MQVIEYRVVHEENYHLENKTYNIIRRGKKKYYLVKFN